VPHASGGVTRWNVFETRNGSNQTTRQWVWGSRYVDEVLFMDKNGSPGTNNTCDPDVADESPQKDRRFFYHQDRNWNVVALSEYADGVGTNARVVERYAYTPYGEFVVLKGDTGSGELGRTLATSTVGNTFGHQGLPLDHEKGSYQNRHREYAATLQRFAQRDPLPARATKSVRAVELNPYLYLSSEPGMRVDPTGMYWTCGHGHVSGQIGPVCWTNAERDAAMAAMGGFLSAFCPDDQITCRVPCDSYICNIGTNSQCVFSSICNPMEQLCVITYWVAWACGETALLPELQGLNKSVSQPAHQ
jgi:RHS repeat-associated protein